MKISLGNGGNFGDFPLVWMEGLQMGDKNGEGAERRAKIHIFRGKTKKCDLCPFGLVAACKRASYFSKNLKIMVSAQIR